MDRIVRHALLLVTLMSVGTLSASAQETTMKQPFEHPGMLHTRQDLAFMKQKVALGAEPWKAAWDTLRSRRSSTLDFQPEPVTHVVRGPYGRPSIGDRELSRSAGAAYGHALQWAVTGDKAHARKAIQILNAWSGVLWDFQDNDAKLLAAWTGDAFCNAAEILRHTDAGWQAEDIERFKRMMLTVYYPLLRNFFPEANGNWDGAIINTLLCIGIFCDDRAIFDRAVDHFLRGRGNGGITKYVYPSGQCQENTRDQGHTQMGLSEFAQACQVAWNQGVDLYGTADNRLALGFEYTARYMLGEDAPAYGVVSEQGRGRFRDIYEGVYQHYRYVKGLEMPYTVRAVERTRGRRRAWHALTMYRGPLSDAVETPTGPPLPCSQAPQAGALAEPTARPPEGAIAVAPGDAIQAALDSCAGGGWVALAEGLHTLPAALRMPSGVTLSGQGLATVLFLDPELTGPAMVSAADDLHGITLRDFVVEGATASSPPRDPNSHRRLRSYQKAPSRSGIAFSAQHAGQMRNLRFEHVTVRNCTHDGVAIRGAADVTVAACDFSDNGCSVVPGPGLQHNLLITRVTGCEVRDSRLDTSPWGSGLDLSHSRNVAISNNEAARNALHGIRATESEDVRVLGNLAEGNDSSGIMFDTLMDGCRRVEVRGNLSRNNGGYGIEVQRVTGATVQDNTVADNAHVNP